jgi:putative ATPase
VVILQNGSTISRTDRSYISQSHLVGPNGSLTQQIAKNYPSFLCREQTTLAQIIAQESKQHYFLSAINSGVNIHEVIEKLKQVFSPPRINLFIDEIHRFSKSQQDSLLAAVEKDHVNRATTENPSFEVIPALSVVKFMY